MFGYYRRRLIWITDRLRHQESNLDDLDNLLVMQRWLVRQIFKVEQRQRGLKSERQRLKVELTTRLDKSQSVMVKRRIQWIDKRHDRLNDVAFIFRCFGDGIAFSYLDRHAVKPLTFEGDGSYFKRSAGALSGKSGLAMEILVLEEAIRRGVPAVLCDLTNSIRHGDVCLLGQSDPYLIEVKTRSKGGDRGRRQMVDVNRLNSFFENDRGELLGAPVSTRAALPSEPVDHGDAMNEAAAEALRSGRCVSSPEPGVHIIAQRGVGRGNPFAGVPISTTTGVYSLNGWKMDRAWLSYRPFTLLLRDPAVLHAFIAGDLFLLVVIDYARFIEAFAANGIEAKFHPGDPYMVSGP